MESELIRFGLSIERWNSYLKTHLQCQLCGGTMEGWGRALQKPVYSLSKHLIYPTVSPIARFHKSRIQEVGKGIVPHIITPSDSLGIFFAPSPCNANFCRPRSFHSKRSIFLPLNCKLSIPPFQFGILMLINQQGKKGITVLGIDSDYYGEI